MGTTLTGLLVAGGEALFAHAGDSRAYLVRGGGATQVSEDHNIQTRLRAAGMEATRREWRGLLTNALGVGDVTRVARFALPMVTGDRIVLLTDGVHEHLGAEAELARVVAASQGPAAAAAALVELAMARGGTDDATALVIEVVSGAPADGPAADRRAREAAAVARCPLFAQLSGAECLRALRITTARALGAGDRLAFVDGGDRAAYVVVEGEAALPAGERLGPGALVHPDALIEGAAPPREPATANAPSRILAIRRRDFLELTEEEPDLGVKLYAALARLMAR
jgi:hypothetical protein